MTLPASIWYAMLEAAPAAPVELEPVAYMASSGTFITAEGVSYTPNWTDYCTRPLVRQSDAAAVIAKLTQERDEFDARLCKELSFGLSAQETINQLREQLASVVGLLAELQQDLQTTADFLRCWREGDLEGCKEWDFEASDALRSGYVKGEEA